MYECTALDEKQMLLLMRTAKAQALRRVLYTYFEYRLRVRAVGLRDAAGTSTFLLLAKK